MFTAASTFARAGVIALGVLTGFGGIAMTAPLGPIDRPAPSVGSSLPIEPVAQGEFRGGSHPVWPRFGGRGGGGGGAWRGGGRSFRGGNWNGNRAWRGNGNWRGNRNWRNNGNWKRNWRGGHGHYHDYDDDDDFGVFLGLGLPLLGGYYGGYYPGYYGGYYPGYYDPGYYAPRRYYRAGTAHERWCYARYRSYRAWDNTFQPYNGPRRQCYSPYS
jgi:hypothetical protein